MKDVFKAIADPTRREILMTLSQQPASIRSISEKFEMTRPAVSKHIRILMENDLVTMQTDSKDGRQHNCYAQLEALAEVHKYITQLEAFWNSKLDGLGGYLAKKKQP